MKKQIKICSRCVLDTTVPDIQFDEKGECNYCKLQDIVEKENTLNSESNQRLSRLIEVIQKRGKNKRYDCVVGVSGGLDSTFVLYSVVKYGLRPLAVHFDNGWDSEIAVSNIKNATTKLEVDLYTYVVDWEEFKDVQIAFLKASVPDVEIPTDRAIKPVLYRAAYDEGIKYIIHGHSFRTEGKIPPLWSYGDSRYIRSVHKKYGRLKNLSTFPKQNLFKLFYYFFVSKLKIIRLLYMIDYKKDEAKKILEEKLGWRDYGGKHYESTYTRFVQSYLLPQKFNIDKRKVHLSGLIRSGQILRSEALSELKNPPISSEQAKEDKEYVAKKLGMTMEEFKEIYSLEPKSFMDYPTYFSYIQKFRPIFKFAYRFISPNTPPILSMKINRK